jgi:aldehyde dehydrogenase (NAD+)
MPRALRIASKIRAGTVAINSSYLPDDNTPFGGYKNSGYGRESGIEGLRAYLQPKTIKINMSF